MIQELNMAGNKIDCCAMAENFDRLINQRLLSLKVITQTMALTPTSIQNHGSSQKHYLSQYGI